jgi:hypothetical protein
MEAMATAVSGRITRAASLEASGRSEVKDVVGQSPLPKAGPNAIAPWSRLTDPAFAGSVSPYHRWICFALPSLHSPHDDLVIEHRGRCKH